MSSLDDALQQINSVAGTFEKTANKSTNTSLGTSNTLYPTQNAVKTYVDTAISAIPVPDLQQVTDAGNVTTQPIYVLDNALLPNVQASLQIDVTSNLPYVLLEDFVNNKISGLSSEQLSFTNGAAINTVKVKATNVTGSVKNIELPNASGNLTLSVNGVGANTSGNVSINLQSVLNAGNSVTNNFQGTNAGTGNTGGYVIAFGLDAGENNTGSEVTAFGSGAAQGNQLSGVTIFSNMTLPTYANHTAAALAITVLLGATPGCTYLYHNQATNSIGAVRL
jgi:hypothetical protein